jgi:hypothetical protein
MAKRPAKKNTVIDEPAEHRGVVVGWTHHDLGASIDLRIQSTVSRAALDANRVDGHHFLMTHSQALMLAKFLLDATGQSLPQKRKPSLWRRFFGERNK